MQGKLLLSSESLGSLLQLERGDTRASLEVVEGELERSLREEVVLFLRFPVLFLVRVR